MKRRPMVVILVLAGVMVSFALFLVNRPINERQIQQLKPELTPTEPNIGMTDKPASIPTLEPVADSNNVGGKTPALTISPALVEIVEPQPEASSLSATTMPNMETSMPPTVTITYPPVKSPSSSSTPVSELPKNSEEPAASVQEGIQGELDVLRSGCMDNVSSIVTEVIASLKDNGEDEEAIATLQQTYLPKIMNEEASCDKQFSELIAEAEKKGVASSDVTNWKGQYEKTKEDARNQALQMLLSAFPIKPRSE